MRAISKEQGKQYSFLPQHYQAQGKACNRQVPHKKWDWLPYLLLWLLNGWIKEWPHFFSTSNFQIPLYLQSHGWDDTDTMVRMEKQKTDAGPTMLILFGFKQLCESVHKNAHYIQIKPSQSEGGRDWRLRQTLVRVGSGAVAFANYHWLWDHGLCPLTGSSWNIQVFPVKIVWKTHFCGF